jgi:RNA polymerase sigma-70 factor (ECF subfamily)
MVLTGPGSDERLDALSDEQLMAELVAGEQEALQVLHGRLAPLVFHMARRRLDAPAAEEVTQDVFLRVWQKAASFDPALGSLRSWILQITHRRVLNELRDRGRRPNLASESEAGLVDLSGHDSGPDDQAWAEYRKSAIRRALAALPREQGQALRLAFFQELSHEQVASFLAVPLGTAKGRIRLALEKLNAPLAALVAVLVAALGVSTWRWTQHRSAWSRDERALAMLTGSHMQSLRLVPPAAAGEVEKGPHATYRAEPGGTMVVFTLANLPPVQAGETYRLWRLAGGTWQLLAEPVPDAQGRGRTLLERPGQPWPQALELTREPRGSAGPAPAGARVLAWNASR